MAKVDEAYEMLMAEWTGEVGQLHKSIKELPDVLTSAIGPIHREIVDAKSELNKRLAIVPAMADREVEKARIAATEKMAASVDQLAERASDIALEIAGSAAQRAKYDAGFFAVVAMSLFAAVMLALGAFIGGNREAWGIVGVVAASAGVGILAGVVIGYYVYGMMSESQKREAWKNDPARKAQDARVRAKINQ